MNDATPAPGHTAPSDDSLDRYARIVHHALGVPMVAVCVVEGEFVTLAGGHGFPVTYASGGAGPLVGSLTWHVVSDAAPLLVDDTGQDERSTGSSTVAHGVVAYAGAPIVDPLGRVLGAVAALDYQPRPWTAADGEFLVELAAACGAELSQRARRVEAQRNEQQAIADGRTARALLSLSEQLASTTTLADVAEATNRIAVDEFGALHAGMWVVTPGAGARGAAAAVWIENPTERWLSGRGNPVFELDTSSAIGTAITQNAAAFYRSIADLDARHPGAAKRGFIDDGDARALLPLRVGADVVGCLVLVWPKARAVDSTDRTTLRALSAYAAQALDRAQLLAERADVATTLQNAMLTRLPDVAGLELVVRYRPAPTADQVGGDWHDVVAHTDGSATLSIGDVVGHDTSAAAMMGQLRSMLRAFVWEGAAPSELVRRLDRATAELDLEPLATLLVAELTAGPGERTLTWTNAGHPPPIVIDPDGRCRSLDTVIDPMLGARPCCVRHDHGVTVVPGSTLLLFTDGVIEQRPGGIDAGRRALLLLLEREHARPLDELADLVIAMLSGMPDGDDAALLAVRVS